MSTDKKALNYQLLHMWPYDKGEFSDGYHTFNELYDHRNTLFCIIANSLSDVSWKTRYNDDGTPICPSGKWFLAGVRLPTGDVSYHLPNEFWDLLDVKELDRAPEYDGYTSDDVLNRLKEYLRLMNTVTK